MKGHYPIAEVEVVGVTSQRLTIFVDDETNRNFPNLPETYALPEDLRKPRLIETHGPNVRLLTKGSIMRSKPVPDYVETEVKSYNGRKLTIEKLEQLLNLDPNLWFSVQSYKRWKCVE